jgi:hypothetical protein
MTLSLVGAVVALASASDESRNPRACLSSGWWRHNACLCLWWFSAGCQWISLSSSSLIENEHVGWHFLTVSSLLILLLQLFCVEAASPQHPHSPHSRQHCNRMGYLYISIYHRPISEDPTCLNQHPCGISISISRSIHTYSVDPFFFVDMTPPGLTCRRRICLVLGLLLTNRILRSRNQIINFHRLNLGVSSWNDDAKGPLPLEPVRLYDRVVCVCVSFCVQCFDLISSITTGKSRVSCVS